jgi:hypothetical protein
MTTNTSAAQTAQTPADKARTAMAILRDRFPTLRRPSAVAIIHNGGNATVFGCLCGATHSAPTRSRAKARHVKDFVAEHAACAGELAARVDHLALQHQTVGHGRVAARNVALVEA